jgi:hypothetical protein
MEKIGCLLATALDESANSPAEQPIYIGGSH